MALMTSALLGHDDVELHRTRDRAAEAARTAADRDDHRPFEMVVVDDARDEVADRLGGRGEHAPGHLFGGKPQGRAGCRERSERGFLITPRVVARLDEAERVRRAGVGERDRAAVGQAHDQVVGGVALARRAQLGGRAGEIGGRQEARVRQPRDVRAARSDAVDTVAADAQHRATRDTEHPHVEGADRSRVAGDLHVRERGPPAPDRRDVGGRAADLDDHRVLDAARSERAGHRRRGPGVERAGGCAPEAGEVGGAAVAAHDHHRAGDAGGRDAGADDFGGAQRDREDRRVQRGGDRPQLEAVEAGELGRRGHRQARLGRGRADRRFVGDVVGRERLRDRDRLGAARAHAGDRRPGDLGRQAVRDVEELGHHRERAALAQLDAGADRALAGLAQVGGAAHADHADLGDRRLRATR